MSVRNNRANPVAELLRAARTGVETPETDRAIEKLGRRIAMKAMRQALTQQDIVDQDKALTDTLNQLFGAGLDYGTDGYELTPSSSPMPVEQDKALTDILNNTFGGHLGYGSSVDNGDAKAQAKDDKSLTDAMNGLFGTNLGYSVTDTGPEDAQSGDKALTDAVNSMFGTSLGYASGAAPSDDEFKAQDDALDAVIKQYFGTDL
jgi:hypothetical protein